MTSYTQNVEGQIHYNISGLQKNVTGHYSLESYIS